MTAAEKIRTLMARKGVSMTEMAEATKQSRQNLSNKMKRDNFQESDMKEMAAVLGLAVDIRFLDADGNVVL